MTHDIVLLSVDPALIAQVQAALAPLTPRLHAVSDLASNRPSPTALLLVDPQALPAGGWAELPSHGAFILLGDPGTRPAVAFRHGALDLVLKRECHLKLAFVVREALATLSYRRRLTRSQVRPMADLQHQHLNRALAIILGHAELVAASSRLPLLLRPRLEAIVEAALSIRDHLDPAPPTLAARDPAATGLHLSSRSVADNA